MSGTGNSIKTIGPSGEQLIDAQLIGTAWDAQTITYSFPLSGAEYKYGSERFSFGPISPQQQTAARFALEKSDGNSANDGFSVEGFTDQAFALTTANNAHVRIGESDVPYTAWAYYPDVFSSSGDVWFGRTFDYRSAEPGNYAWATMLHEIGHAIGLKHGHETIAYGPLPSNQDSMEYSIMTYRSYVGASITAGYQNSFWDFAQTYMMADIAALQWMYGANFTTNSGNTHYLWRPGQGDTWVNGVKAIDAGGSKIFATVWDGGGVDTYDLSAYGSALSIDLRPGEHSIFATNQLADLGLGNTARGNIFNALRYQGDPRSLIENAIGGSGNDTITGNAADNDLKGLDGNDRLYGLGADDSLFGGSGIDRLTGGLGDDRLSGGAEDDVSFFGSDGSDSLFGAAGGDHSFHGGSGHDRIYGIAGDDSLLFGGSGNDGVFGGIDDDAHLYGGDGDDTLDGKKGEDQNLRGASGDDRLSGNNGNDSSLWGGTGDDLIFGGQGSDRNLNGDAGTDQLFGGMGADTLIGASGFDRLVGGSGTDRLQGGLHADKMYGGDGVDRLFGGSGRDTIDGGTSSDTLIGGSSDDWFMVSNGSDLFLDFSGRQFGNAGEQDRFVFGSGQEVGNFVYRGSQAFTGSGNSEARFTSGKVRVDSDGDGQSDLVFEVAGLTVAGQLTASDFLWL